MSRSSRESTLAAQLVGVGVAAMVGAYIVRRTNRTTGTLVGLLVVPIVERSVTRLATALRI
jgi:tetrahydromethanopterin S-methyltransferase subunit C